MSKRRYYFGSVGEDYVNEHVEIVVFKIFYIYFGPAKEMIFSNNNREQLCII